MAEGRIVTRIDLEYAASSTATHPVVRMLECHQSQIAELRAEMAKRRSVSDQFAYIDNNSGFLVDAVVGVGEFSLGATDIVTIFSRGQQLYPYGHSLANMGFSTYSMRGLPPAEWGGFSGYYAKHHGIPKDLRADKQGLTHVKKRLAEIGDNMDTLRFAEGIKHTKQLKSPESQKNPLDELLEQIKEINGNILPFLFYNVATALSHLTTSKSNTTG